MTFGAPTGGGGRGAWASEWPPGAKKRNIRSERYTSSQTRRQKDRFLLRVFLFREEETIKEGLGLVSM
jgi:hypothetical protein